MKAFGRFIGGYGSRRKSHLFGAPDSLMGAAKDAVQRRGGTARMAKRYGLRAGLYAGTGIGAAAYSGYKLSNFRDGLVKGMYPGSVMPMETGRFGIRTSTSPAGIGGVRFNFRRT